MQPIGADGKLASVQLTWTAYPGATAYAVIRDGTEVGTTAVDETGFADLFETAAVGTGLDERGLLGIGRLYRAQEPILLEDLPPLGSP